MNAITYVFPGGCKNGIKNQANIHRMPDYLRSWRNENIVKLLLAACTQEYYRNENKVLHYLSGENREKLLSVGTTPARLLYDTFLSTNVRTMFKNKKKLAPFNIFWLDLQGIKAEAVHRWRNISRYTVIFQFSRREKTDIWIRNNIRLH
jgi:hypothetical protein